MKLSFAVPFVAAILMAATLPSAFAFEPASNDQFPADTFSSKLADPDDIAADMATQQNTQDNFGQNATVAQFGGFSIGIAQGTGFGPPGMGVMPGHR